ncbi:hypothetical protein EMIHUDRAFT_207842 [Emiliania huxleyi CCMP1516]|uniref:Uncharacterized protein n=2 Tax=Emiliania huxleyi TaxID=2903 RepID=A0A0D3JE35_EMIH1|nr:hypothetical protein EMIHUDRAFT_207842 [Emiliania huxleyi CCMP1516]EOD21770.1 hypothetical protein EMIHUDRAFT_207842 [Emiliania huxleyi CCMP1516]|eukprot:XP_005774199.1 hypothetical protein EMIHUDRAFT_207842 [Emiliania huxleyi CCMP1516]
MLAPAPPSPRASRRRSPAARISAAVAPLAVTEFRALREATHAGAGASIATSLAAAFRALREAAHAGAGASIATSLAAAVATRPVVSSGFGGADDFRFAPRAAAGFDDEDRPSLVIDGYTVI